MSTDYSSDHRPEKGPGGATVRASGEIGEGGGRTRLAAEFFSYHGFYIFLLGLNGISDNYQNFYKLS